MATKIGIYTHTCGICGHYIYSDESIRRGYGSECTAALNKAKYIVIFSDDNLKSKYYNLDICFLKECIEKETPKKLRNEFKKSFLSSVKEQIDTKHFLTKKQRDILLSMLVYPYMDRTEEYKEMLKIRREKMLDEIEVNTELIEKARQIIREESKKKSLAC